jgi:hypothetical protein
MPSAAAITVRATPHECGPGGHVPAVQTTLLPVSHGDVPFDQFDRLPSAHQTPAPGRGRDLHRVKKADSVTRFVALPPSGPGPMIRTEAVSAENRVTPLSSTFLRRP